MLSEPLLLDRVESTQLFDFLYHFFERDFVHDKTYLANKIYINPRNWRKEDGKEQDFWHLTTRKDVKFIWQNNQRIKKTERYPDYKRAKRLEWVKQIITHHNHEQVKLFYHQESNYKKDIRLYLWAYEYDFVVILQKMGKSESFLVTSFYIDYDNKRQTFEQRYQNYLNNVNNLQMLKWF